MRGPRVMIAAVLVVAGLGWVASRALSGNVVYYQTPSEVVSGRVTEEAVRMGGFVVPGSATRTGEEVRFVVSDGTTDVTVVGTGGVPALFREGQGVVVEGRYGPDALFHADTVLVKHGSEYRPPSEGETPTTADLEEA